MTRSIAGDAASPESGGASPVRSRSLHRAVGPILAAAVVVGISAVLASRGADSEPDQPASSVVAQQAAHGAFDNIKGCTAASGGALPGKPPPEFDVRPPEVTGAQLIDTGDMTPTAAVAAFDSIWIAAPDPGDDVGGTQFIARVASGGASLEQVAPVIGGCVVTDIAADDTALWVATCNDLTAPGDQVGANIVQVDPKTLTAMQAIPLPAQCLAGVDAGDGVVSAFSLGLAGEQSQAWSIDANTGAVTKLATEGFVRQVSLAAGRVWVGEAAKVSEVDEATGAKQAEIAIGQEIFVGANGQTLWSVDFVNGAAVRHGTAEKATLGATALPGAVQAAVPIPSGLLVQTAEQGSTVLTISSVDESGALRHVTDFDTGYLTRAGVPQPLYMLADRKAVLLVFGGHLFRLDAALR